MGDRAPALALLASLALTAIACDAGDAADERPDPEGVYVVDVTGATQDEFPEVQWPSVLRLELIDQTGSDDDETLCYAGDCGLGNVMVTVDRAVPSYAHLSWPEAGADLSLVFYDFPLLPADPGRCDGYWAVGSARLHLEDDRVQGTAEASAECIDNISDDELEDFVVTFLFELSGSRADDSTPLL